MSKAPSAVDVAKWESGDGLRTEFAFELPRGYVDDDGNVAPPGDHAARHRA